MGIRSALFVVALVLGSAASAQWYDSQSTTYQQIGNTTYGSNGTSYQQIGNTTYGSNGTSYQQIGNMTYGSNGTSYQQIGNMTYGNNGTTAHPINSAGKARIRAMHVSTLDGKVRNGL